MVSGHVDMVVVDANYYLQLVGEYILFKKNEPAGELPAILKRGVLDGKKIKELAQYKARAQVFVKRRKPAGQKERNQRKNQTPAKPRAQPSA